jgi:peptidoglycan/LPS O-acetylase OafA/YrhL
MTTNGAMPEEVAEERIISFSERPLAPHPKLGSHIPALDGLRGLAILLVMLHHFTTGVSSDTLFGKLLSKLAYAGWSGVDLFFVLSGFLITGILFDSKTSPNYFRNFYIRRALRIFPLYYATLFLIFMVLPFIKSFNPAMQRAADAQTWLWFYCTNIFLALREQWFYDVDWLTLGHFWSLSVEEHFYFIWPAVIFLFSRRTSMAICIGCIAAALAIRATLVIMGGHLIGVYVLTPCRMDTLAIGAFLALVARGNRGLLCLAPHARFVATVCAIVLLAIFCWQRNWDQHHWLMQTLGYSTFAFFFASVLILSVVTSPTKLMQRFFSHAALQVFGKYSYALYMFHVPLLPVFRKLFPINDLSILFHSYFLGLTFHILLSTILSLLVALLSWHLYEKHFLKLKKFFSHGGPSSITGKSSSEIQTEDSSKAYTFQDAELGEQRQ